MHRFHRDIAASRRMGRIALSAASVLGLLVGFTLIQGIWVAVRTGRNELILGAGFGLLLLALASAWVARLGLQQKRHLDAAQQDLDALEKDWQEAFGTEEEDG